MLSCDLSLIVMVLKLSNMIGYKQSYKKQDTLLLSCIMWFVVLLDHNDTQVAEPELQIMEQIIGTNTFFKNKTKQKL